MLVLVVCTSSLLIKLPVQGPATSFFAQINLPGKSDQQLPNQLSDQELERLARAITVKVLAGNTWGSGILIQRQQSVYTVVTNAHVIRRRNAPYFIQTHDGESYQASLLEASHFGGDDLVLLQFHSRELAYQAASFKPAFTFLAKDAEVFASGYPIEADPFISRGFVFKSGKVSVLLHKAMAGGYQVGYAIRLEQGMSGGPLLNRQGEVIGINGKSSYPLAGYPSAYQFEDGSAPIVQEELMLLSSWAIPIESLAQQVPPSLPLSLTWDAPANITVLTKFNTQSDRDWGNVRP